MKKIIHGKKVYYRQPRIDEYETAKTLTGKKPLKQTRIDGNFKKRQKPKEVQLSIFSAIKRAVRKREFKKQLENINSIEERIKQLEERKKNIKFTGWMKDKAENEIDKEIRNLKLVQKKLDKRLSEM